MVNSAGHQWLVETYRGQDGLYALRGAWGVIVSTIGKPAFYHLYRWYESYLAHLESTPSQVCFFLISRSGKPVAIVPLKQSSRTFFRVKARTLELPYHPHMPLTDIICHQAKMGTSIMQALLEHLKKSAIHWDVLLFPRILEFAAALSLLGETSASKVILLPGEMCNKFSCKTDKEWTLQLSKNIRNNLAKSRKKLHTFPEASFVSVRGDIPDLEGALEEFMRVEASGWKGASGMGSAIALHEGLRKFYRGLLYRKDDPGAVEINLLKLGAEAIAGQFAIIVDATCYLLKIGYNEKYAALSPGNLLLEHSLHRYVASGEVETVNLISNALGNSSWHPTSYRSYRAMLFSDSPRGVLINLLMNTKEALKKHLPRRSPAWETR